MSIVLNCVARASLGKSASKNVRLDGVIPAVVYTKDGKNLNVLISSSQIEKLITDPSFMTYILKLKVFENIEHATIANFKVEINQKSILEIHVITKDIQFHIVKDKVTHIDFKAVTEGDAVNVKIPVKFINKNECMPLKFGGNLNVMNYNPLIKGIVGKIPPYLEIDLTGRKSNTIIRLSEAKIPENVTIIKDCDIAKVCGKRGLEEESVAKKK